MFLIAPLIGPEIDQSEIVTLAAKRAGLTLDCVARIYGCSPQQFGQQIRGIGHLSVRRLIGMAAEEDGRRFLSEYWPLVGKEMGLPHIEAAMALWRAFNSVEWRDTFLGLMVDRVQVKMLKADIRDVEEERRRA